MSLPPPSSKAERTRTRIVDAAKDIFELKGYEKATVSEIVRRADIAQGTFYHHFDSKADLPAALTQRYKQIIFSQGEQILLKSGNTTLSQALETLIHMIFATAETYGSVFSMVASSSLLTDEISEREQTAHPLMLRFLEQQQNAGVIGSSVNLTFALRLMDSAMIRLAKDVLVSKVTVDKDQYIQATIDFICRGLGVQADAGLALQIEKYPNV